MKFIFILILPLLFNNLYADIWDIRDKAVKQYKKGNCKNAIYTIENAIANKFIDYENLYSKLSNIYLDQWDNCKSIEKNLDKAFYYLNKSVQHKKSGYDKIAEIYYYGLMNQTKNINLALQYYLEEFNNILPQHKMNHYVLYQIGKIYYEKNNITEACKYLYLNQNHNLSKKLLLKICNKR